MNYVNGIKAAASAVLAALTALWGWFGWMVIAWIICMLIDYLTGSAAALKTGEWSSQMAREGLWHKAGCIAAVVISGLLDIVIGQLVANIPNVTLPFVYTVFLCPLVVIWYILTEIGSVIENAGKMGAPLPGWLKKAVAVLRDTVDKAGDELVDRDGTDKSAK